MSPVDLLAVEAWLHEILAKIRRDWLFIAWVAVGGVLIPLWFFVMWKCYIQ